MYELLSLLFFVFFFFSTTDSGAGDYQTSAEVWLFLGSLGGGGQVICKLLHRQWPRILLRCQWHSDLMHQQKIPAPPGVVCNWPPTNSASYCGDLPHVIPPNVDFTLATCTEVLQEVLRWCPKILNSSQDAEDHAGETMALEGVVGKLLHWRNELAVASGQHLTRETALGKFKYSASKLLKCVMLSRSLRNKQSLRSVIQRAIEVGAPAFVGRPLSANLQADAANVDAPQIPSQTTVAEHELSLDLAIVSITRAKSTAEWVRYGWSDSSPLAGYDWLWVQELCIRKDLVVNVMLAVHSQHCPIPPTFSCITPN